MPPSRGRVDLGYALVRELLPITPSGTTASPPARWATRPSNPAATTTPTAAINGLQWTGAVNGDWSTNPSSLNWRATAGGAPSLSYSDNQSVLLDDSGSANTTISVSAANVAPASVTFNNNAYNYKLTGAYGITGTATLTLNGSGMVTLSNSNTYSARDDDQCRTLVIGAAAGASPNSTFTLNANNGSGLRHGRHFRHARRPGRQRQPRLDKQRQPERRLAVGANGQNATYTGILSGGGSLVKIGTAVNPLADSTPTAARQPSPTARCGCSPRRSSSTATLPPRPSRPPPSCYYSAMSSAQQQSLVWVGAGDASLENQFVGTVGWTVPPGGGQAMQIQDLGSVTQVVNVPAAGNYQLTWGAEGATGSGIYKNTLEVLLDSTQVGGAFIAPASTWTSYDYSMYMTAGTHTIEFEGTAANTAARTGAGQRRPDRQRRPAPDGRRRDGGGTNIHRRARWNPRPRGPQPDRGRPHRRRHVRQRNDLRNRYQQRYERFRSDRHGREPVRRRACRRNEQAGPDCQRQPDAHRPEHLHRSDDGQRRHAGRRTARWLPPAASGSAMRRSPVRAPWAACLSMAAGPWLSATA